MPAEAAARLERWRREAADVRRATATMERFDPWAGVGPLPGVAEAAAKAAVDACPNSSTKRQGPSATRTFCGKAYRRWFRNDDGEPVAVWLPCRSRTCKDCRPDIDQADTGRVAEAVGPWAYLVEIDTEQWPTVYQRLKRRGASGVRIPSRRQYGRIVVVADQPPTPNAQLVRDPAAVDGELMRTRPTGLPPAEKLVQRPGESAEAFAKREKTAKEQRQRDSRRMTTFGQVPSRDEWETGEARRRCAGMREHFTDEKGTEQRRCRNRAVRGEDLCRTCAGTVAPMARTVNPDDVERLAAALGAPYVRQADGDGEMIRLRVPWDDWRAEALRKWSQNPAGDSWEQQRWETLVREGAENPYDPPGSVYDVEPAP